MKQKFLKIAAMSCLAAVLLSGCIKNKDKELGDAGTTLIKILEAPEKKNYYAPFSDVKVVDVFSVRKDAPTNTELNTATSIKVTMTEDYIDRYNDDNGTAYEVLPDSLYTTAVPKSGNVYDLSLASGQSAKEFTIQLNGAKWDLSRTYALAFYLSETGGKTIAASRDTVIAFFSIINQWDGVYEITGSMVDATNPAFAILPPPMTLHMITDSRTTVATFDPIYFVDYIATFYTGTTASGYGSFSPVFEFDPATNKIISVVNAYGQPAGNTRSAGLDPSGENLYDPDTKTIKVKFFMYQPSVVTAAPHIRTSFNWEMKYTGAR